MKPKVSLPHSQVSATCPYPEPALSSSYPHIPLLQIHLSIILSSTPGSPHWSLSPRFPYRNPVHASPFPVTRYMSHLSHSAVNSAVNTFHLGYKNQSVYAVSGTSRCLFLDKYKTHKYSVGSAYSCWMLNCWCITWPVGFKRLMSWEDGM